MSQTKGQPDLFSLVYGTPWIDPSSLAAAIVRELRGSLRDFRTRLLLRDSMKALESRWGVDRFQASLPADLRPEANVIRAEDLGDPGYTTLERRMADAVSPETILRFFRELGDRLRSPARLDVGGSTALIVRGLLSRATDDIDAVDELPQQVRVEYQLLDELAGRYALRLTHFQSHYLPDGWANRVHSLGRFGRLDVHLVDATDIAVGKLFSKRTKDLDDLRMLSRAIDKADLSRRLQSAGTRLRADPILLPHAQKNWYVLFGEDLPA